MNKFTLLIGGAVMIVCALVFKENPISPQGSGGLVLMWISISIKD